MSIDPLHDYPRLLAGHHPDPYPVYAHLRTHSPLYWSDQVESWVLTRFVDVQAVLQHDPRLTAERLTRLLSQLPAEARAPFSPLYEHLSTFVQFYDPPDHRRLRATAAPAFARSEVERHEATVRKTVEKLLDDMEARRSIDLIRDLAIPLPTTIIGEVLGIPPEMRFQFKVWADAIAAFFEGVADNYAAVTKRANDAVVDMKNYLDALLANKRAEPDGDMLSGLIGHVEGGNLTEEELYGWAMFLMLAGHETTTGLIGNGAIALMERPNDLSRFRIDVDGTRRAVEELLRFDSPIQRISRVALDDYEFEEGVIRKGDRIWAMIGAANRDPSQFDEPNTLDLDRTPNRHVAFGYGVHVCLGASLARLEGQIAIRDLFDRFPNLRLTSEPIRRPGVSLHQWASAPASVS